MIDARVSKDSVEKLKKAIQGINDQIKRLAESMSVIEDVYNYADEQLQELQNQENELNNAIEHVNGVIDDLNNRISEIEDEIADVESEIDDVESELSSTDSTITRYDDEGNSYEVSNPHYDYLCSRLSRLESQLSSLTSKLNSCINKLKHAEQVSAKLDKSIQQVQNAIQSMRAVESNCKNYNNQISDNKTKMEKSCSVVEFKLATIETIIDKYTTLKLETSQKTSGIFGFGNKTNNKYNYSSPKLSFNSISNAKYSSKEDCIKESQRSKGDWSGKPGESIFRPVDAAAITRLKEFNIDSIVYKNGIPDFEPISVAKVVIPMVADRDKNYDNADKALAIQWSKEGKDGKHDWKKEDVEAWRKKNRFSWHECIDCKTCQLVAKEPHLACKHRGGYSECKKRDQMEGASQNE